MKISDIKNFAARHFLTLILLVVPMLLIPVSVHWTPEIKAMTLCIAYESLALFLCGIANYVFTNIKFHEEKQDMLGFIFIGVHILTGLTIAGVYWLEFLQKSVMPF
jgi:hypothetical protein